jgi:hypothetical protein
MIEKKQLGLVESTSLGFEHGILSFWISFNFGGSGQGFGGYVLDDNPDPNVPGAGRRGTVKGLEAISKILKAAGVEKWEDLKGKSLWTTRERDGFGTEIIEIEAPDFVKHGEPFNIIKHFKE